MFESGAWLPLLVTTAVAIASWYAAHLLASRRDRANKRRELLVTYLIEAYRRLESGANRQMTSEQAQAVESAIADIQLFGNTRQVELVQAFAQEIAEMGDGSLDELLVALRADLRRELDLAEVPARLRYLRFKRMARPK